ncbi:hypothetical protein HDU76_000626 [Blyttiomyces sp. JEL0837]|nr:hypothetical protein HDU76_000626 [Blyttiomyces sp. JEL0837]
MDVLKEWSGLMPPALKRTIERIKTEPESCFYSLHGFILLLNHKQQCRKFLKSTMQRNHFQISGTKFPKIHEAYFADIRIDIARDSLGKLEKLLPFLAALYPESFRFYEGHPVSIPADVPPLMLQTSWTQDFDNTIAADAFSDDEWYMMIRIMIRSPPRSRLLSLEDLKVHVINELGQEHVNPRHYSTARYFGIRHDRDKNIAEINRKFNSFNLNYKPSPAGLPAGFTAKFRLD